MKTKLLRFNPRRVGRTGAAEVEIEDEDGVCRLWMTKRDVEKNIIALADCQPEETAGLRDALAAYRTPGKEIR